MDKIIRYVVTSNLVELSKILESGYVDNINKKDYYKLYHYFIYFYIHEYISDRTMYLLTYLFAHKYRVIKVNKIIDYDYLMPWHIFKAQNRNRTYLILNLYMDIYTQKERIYSTINFFKNNSLHIRRLFDDNPFIDYKGTRRMKKVIKDRFLRYIERYNDKILLGNIMLANNSESLMLQNSLEIENRLMLLVKYFGIKFMQMIGVEIVDANYFRMMTYDEKILYYKRCVDMIYGMSRSIYGLFECLKRSKKMRDIPKNDYIRYKETLGDKNNTDE